MTNLFGGTPTFSESEALRKCKACLDVVAPHPDYITAGNPTRGKCYIASVGLLYYLGLDKGYSLIKAVDSMGSHYWVESPLGVRLDPTKEQFDVMKIDPPYSLGRNVGFRRNIKRHEPLLKAMKEME